jgi:hypothetical protein
MPVTPTEQEKRSPKWQDYMQQVLGHTGERAGIQMFPEGTKTMRHKEMTSANRRHSQSIAQADRDLAARVSMHSAGLTTQERIHAAEMALKRAEFEQDKLEFELNYALDKKASEQTSSSWIGNDNLLNQALSGYKNTHQQLPHQPWDWDPQYQKDYIQKYYTY